MSPITATRASQPPAVGAPPLAPNGAEPARAATYDPRPDVLVLLVTVLAYGIATPLADPDLPMHLAIGEWIVQHRAVPFTEPFAWTRPGAPYYAYSWLAQVTFFLIYQLSGPLGLRVLYGLLLAGSGMAVGVLGRTLEWRPPVTIAIAACQMVAAVFIVPALRPQLVLFLLVPVSWAAAYRILRAERIRGPAVALAGINALAANTHILFPLVGVPMVLAWVYAPRERRRRVALVAAIAVGWMLSPYTLSWWDMFRINFGGNVLTTYPSPIAEYTPGSHVGLLLLAGLALPLGVLVLLPWMLRGTSLTRRELVAGVALWVVGLWAYGYAVRMLLVWWLSLLPAIGCGLMGLARSRAVSAGEGRPPRWGFRAVLYAACAVVLALQIARGRDQWRFEASGHRRVATAAGEMLDPLARWLKLHTDPGSRGRLYTFYDLGGYLTWRLHNTYSASSDSRAIFPDSIVASEAYVRASHRPVPVGPWSAAELAVVPTSYRVTDSLAASPPWHRAAYVVARPPLIAGRAPPDTLVLWVRRDWWSRVGRGSLPDQPVELVPFRVQRAATP